MNGALKIGLTFRSDLPDVQIWWGSGIAQNLKFYCDLFSRIGHTVVLLTPDPVQIQFGGRRYQSRTLLQVVEGGEQFDIIFEAGVTISINDKTAVREATGARIVGLRCGNQLFTAAEGLFVKQSLPCDLYVGGQDSMWILPHHAYQAGFVSTLHRCVVEVVPYIWMPDFVSTTFTGDPIATAPDIYVMEPNISVLKNALVPMAIVQALFDLHPDAFGNVYIMNSENFSGKDYFLHNFVSNFPILDSKANRVTFCPRHPAGDVLSDRSIILGYQHENGLNNLYMEALYMGLPLVHNSPYYQDAGYFYPDQEIHLAVQQLMSAIRHSVNETRSDRSERLLSTFRIDNDDVVDTYNDLLWRTVETRSQQTG